MITCLYVALAISCSPFVDWTERDTRLHVVSSALIVADWAQTRELSRRPKYEEFYETNPILGNQPDIARINRYFITSLVAHSVIATRLPQKWRERWQTGVIAIEASAVANNNYIGLRIKW